MDAHTILVACLVANLVANFGHIQLPWGLIVSDTGVLFLDVLANANFADFGDYSSIINTEVDGTTLSTSTRIGYRWLTDDNAWMLCAAMGFDT